MENRRKREQGKANQCGSVDRHQGESIRSQSTVDGDKQKSQCEHEHAKHLISYAREDFGRQSSMKTVRST
jgi:hypothetical protein